MIQITYQGHTRTIDEWAAVLGIAKGTLRCRLQRGWTIEEALGEPIIEKNVDLTGKEFGKWTVLEFVGFKGIARYYSCRCQCGTISEVRATCLVNKHSTQCVRCSALVGAQATTTHGLSPKKQRTKIYRTHKGMKQRCYNKKTRSYPNYGGRGIYVCNEWLNDVVQFHKDMGDPPSPEHSIGRIDNDGPYAPWNCRWETAAQQARNKRPPKRKPKPR